MTVPASRTINNLSDTQRKTPSTTLSPRVLTSLEGVIVESLVGPGVAGVVTLSRPARGVPVLVLAHDGAGALEVGGVAPAAVAVPVVPTHFTFVNRNPAGVAEITEVGGRDYSGSTLVVFYQPDDPEETVGGQTTVSA